jgi:acyl-CoA dehydrogenase
MRESARRFAEQEIVPYYAEWEKARAFPRELWNKFGEAGFLCVDIPEEYGGMGAPFEYSLAVVEEVSRLGATSVMSSVGMHSDIVAHYILNSGTEEQKKHWLPKMAAGEVVTGLAMTEPNAGSDVQAIQTRAVVDGDGWVVNGSKIFITNGDYADMMLTAVKTDPEAEGYRGISLLMLDAHAEGYSKGAPLEKLGMHSSGTCELFFQDLRAPQDALLGELNQGFACMMNELPRERLVIGHGAVLGGEIALEMAVEYVTNREAFGQKIAQFQNTRFKLAEMKTDIAVNRAFFDKCVEMFLKGQLDAATASMVKLASTEMQGRVVDGCLQMFGGYGYMMETPITQAYADARVQRIYGGSSEIMKELIARSLVGKG